MTSSSAPVVRRESSAAAIAALVKWMRARSAGRPPQLLADDSDDLLYLVLSLRRVPALSRTNPILLPLPHPLFPSDLSPSPSDPSPSFSVCLFAPDPPEAAAAALARARALSLPVADAIPLSALRSDFKPFESRRRLCASHDLFVADRRVLPLLPRLLGKSFFRKKKIPLPLDLSRPGWPLQLRRLLRSTFLYLRSGTCCAIKVGRLSMDPELVVDNIVAVADAAAARLPRKWANVRSLHVKAVDSVALPIYQIVPELGLKIDVPEEKAEEGKRQQLILYDDVDDADNKDEEEEKAEERKRQQLILYDYFDDADNKDEEEKAEEGKRQQILYDYVDDADNKDEEEEEAEEKKRKRAKKGASLELETAKQRKERKKKQQQKKKGSNRSNGEDSANADDANYDISGVEMGADEQKSKEKKKIKKSTKRKDAPVLDEALAAAGELEKKKIKTEKAEVMKVKKSRSKVAA